MGVPSRLWAEISHEPGASIGVSGTTRLMQPAMAAVQERFGSSLCENTEP
jgi:hypothetical protein